MRHFTLVPILGALIYSALAAVIIPSRTVPETECLSELPCNSVINPGFKANELTNAQRLARGLPPKRPVRPWIRGLPKSPRSGNGHSPPRPPPKPGHGHNLPPPPPRPPTHTSKPSSTPGAKHRGIIQVKRKDTNESLGYISASSFNGAQLRYDASKDAALILSFKLVTNAKSGSQINLIPENSDITGFSFLGLVQGKDNTDSNLGAGSYHYDYWAMTNETPAGSIPKNVGNSYSTVTDNQRTSESAVWFWNASDNKITPQWINSDKSVPAIQTFTQSTALYISGDTTAFSSKYPAPVTLISLTWVPI